VKHDAYLVTWRDSSSLRGWHHATDPEHTAAVITSIGWLIRRTKDAITLTTSFSENNNVVDAITIPIEAVVKMKRLRT